MTPKGKHSYATFVRSSVKTIPATKTIIDDIVPYFPEYTKCIGGYVDDGDQFWKVNYHWELLVRRIKRAIDHVNLSEKHIQCSKAILQVLKNNSPNPATGYCASKVMGSPKDLSNRAVITARWKTLRQCKRDFKSVITMAGIIGPGKNDKKHVPWYLAVAPVARPGTSKHGVGYALDICGRSKIDNPEIRKISSALGASLVFDEDSHVHIEFKRGVIGGKSAKLAFNGGVIGDQGDNDSTPNVGVAPSDTVTLLGAHEMVCHINANPTDPEVNEHGDNPLILLQIGNDVIDFLRSPIDWIWSD